MSVSSCKLQQILEYIASLARKAGDHILGSSGRGKAISYKSEVDLITQFDGQSQDMLVAGLRKTFPDFGILSEENINLKQKARIRWIIDPLDGTTNFAHNLPIWAISLGLEVEGEVVLGVVYDPNRKELFSSIKGQGAYLNNKRIRVSKTSRLGQSLLVTGFPYDIRRSRDNNLNHFADFAVIAQAVRRLGSAALDLCFTACGRFDGYWELKLSPWDQAAGYIILMEAGGMVTDFKGRRFSIYGDRVLGTNGLIHRPMMRVLNKNE